MKECQIVSQLGELIGRNDFKVNLGCTTYVSISLMWILCNYKIKGKIIGVTQCNACKCLSFTTNHSPVVTTRYTMVFSMQGVMTRQ